MTAPAFDSNFLANLDPSIAAVLNGAMGANVSSPPAVSSSNLNATDIGAKILQGATSSQDVMNALAALGNRVSPTFADSVARSIQSDPSLSSTWNELSSSTPTATSDGTDSPLLDSILNDGSTSTQDPYTAPMDSATTAAAMGQSGASSSDGSKSSDTPFWRWGLDDLKKAMLGLLLGFFGVLIIGLCLYSIFAKSNASKFFQPVAKAAA